MNLPHLIGMDNPDIGEDIELKSVRAIIINRILMVISILGSFVYVSEVVLTLQRGDYVVSALYTIFIVIVIILAFVRKLPTSFRIHAMLTITYGLGIISVYTDGLTGNGRLVLVAYMMLASLLASTTISYVGLGLTMVGVTLIGIGMVTGFIPVPPEAITTQNSSVNDWIVGIFLMLVLSLVTMSSAITMIQSMKKMLNRQKNLANQLTEERARLEERVADRTTQLERRAAQMEAAIEVSREITQETSLEDLLTKTVDLVREKFGFYHAGIFIMDDASEYAVLRASTGEAGRKMLENHHRLRSGAEGIVGYVVSRAEPRVAFDVGQDAVHFKNPLLPETRSEMAVPLRVGTYMIGALDVQSKEEAAFSGEDIRVLQSIADSLAITIFRSRQIDNLTMDLDELRAGTQQQIRKNWQGQIKNLNRTYSYEGNRFKVATNQPEPDHVKTVLQHGNSLISQPLNIEEKSFRSITVPIRLRGQVLGAVDMQVEGDLVPADVMAFTEAAADRLAEAMESARLLEEIQNRAEREHMISAVASRVRASSEIDQILRTAAVELGQSLGVSEVRVQLKPSNPTNA